MDLTLDFGNPSKLLGVDVFAEIMMQGWRTGPPGSPVAFETKSGGVGSCTSVNHAVSHHVSVFTGDDILRKFWEIQEQPLSQPV